MVLLKVFPDWALVLSPVVFGLFAATHKNVDVRLLVNGMLTVPPLQIVALFGLVIAGSGFTVTEIDVVSEHTVPGLMISVTVYVPRLEYK